MPSRTRASRWTAPASAAERASRGLAAGAPRASLPDPEEYIPVILRSGCAWRWRPASREVPWLPPAGAARAWPARLASGLPRVALRVCRERPAGPAKEFAVWAERRSWAAVSWQVVRRRARASPALASHRDRIPVPKSFPGGRGGHPAGSLVRRAGRKLRMRLSAGQPYHGGAGRFLRPVAGESEGHNHAH